jgi:hypothetical protein
MCRCTPEIRTPFCGKPGCEWPNKKKPKGARKVYVRGPVYESDRVLVGVDAAGNLHIHINGEVYSNDEIADHISTSPMEGV